MRAALRHILDEVDKVIAPHRMDDLEALAFIDQLIDALDDMAEEIKADEKLESSP